MCVILLGCVQIWHFYRTLFRGLLFSRTQCRFCSLLGILVVVIVNLNNTATNQTKTAILKVQNGHDQNGHMRL